MVGRVLIDDFIGGWDVVCDHDGLQGFDEERSLLVSEDGITRLGSLGGVRRGLLSDNIVGDDADDVFLDDESRSMVAFEGDVVVLEAIGPADRIPIGCAHVAVQLLVGNLLGAYIAVEDLENMDNHSPSIDELDHKCFVN